MFYLSTTRSAAADFLLPLCWQQDATELVSRLASFHYTAQTRPEKKHYAHYGLDLVDGVVRDNVEAGVLEPVLAKVKIVQVRSASTDLI